MEPVAVLSWNAEGHFNWSLLPSNVAPSHQSMVAAIAFFQDEMMRAWKAALAQQSQAGIQVADESLIKMLKRRQMGG